MIIDVLKKFGLLRSALIAVVVFLIALSPFAGGHVRFEGWALITTLVAPVFYVVMVFVLPLDIVMTRVFMSDKTGEERQRFKLILWTEVILLVLMLLSWAPFVAKLLRLA